MRGFAQLSNSNGEAKLMDFGITVQVDDSLGVCDTFVGSYNYMSPERILGKPYSFKADVWSFGIVMLEWLEHCLLCASVADTA